MNLVVSRDIHGTDLNFGFYSHTVVEYREYKKVFQISLKRSSFAYRR